MPKHSNNLKRLRSQRGITQEKKLAKVESALEREIDDFTKHQSLLKRALVVFLADIMIHEKESLEKISILRIQLGTALRTVFKDNGPPRDLLIALLEITKTINGQEVYVDEKTKKLRINLPESTLSHLRKKQFIVNEKMAILMGYENQNELKTFFNVANFAESFN